MIGAMDWQESLDYIVAGTCAKFDLYKVITDHEEDVGIPSGVSGYDLRRYACLLVGSGIICDLLRLAIPLKPYIRDMAYAYAIFRMAWWEKNLDNSQYTVAIDGKRVGSKDTEHSADTGFLMHWASAWMPECAQWTYAGVNDGTLITTWKNETFSLKGMGKHEEKKKAGYGSAYDVEGYWIRGSKIRVEKEGK